MRETKNIYAAVAILTLFTLAGFFLIFNSLGALRGDVENMKLALYFKEQKTQENVASSTDAAVTMTTSTIQIEKETNSDSPVEKSDPGIEIPTAIIFESSSTVALLPQTTVTVTIESAIKYADGSIAINIRAFTDRAASYAAFDPKSVIQILNLDGDNQKASSITGKFDSIPPKSASSGTLNFEGLSGRNSMIFQIGTGETMRFYEFDFIKKTYQETVVG